MTKNKSLIIIALLISGIVIWYILGKPKNMAQAVANSGDWFLPFVSGQPNQASPNSYIINVENGYTPRNMAIPSFASGAKYTNCLLCGTSDNVNNLIPAGRTVSIGSMTSEEILYEIIALNNIPIFG